MRRLRYRALRVKNSMFKRNYHHLAQWLNIFQSPLLLVLRLVWGWQFFLAGWDKIPNIEKIVGFFGALGIPLPFFSAFLVTFVEAIGGILLILGLLTRLSSFFLAITMAVALVVASSSFVKIAFDPTELFAEIPFLFLLVSLILLAFGPGKYSLDRRFHLE